MVARSESRQSVQALNELERRNVVGRLAGKNGPPPGKRGHHPKRHPDAKPVSVYLGRWHVVKEPTMLVVREQEGRATPDVGLTQRRDQLLLEPHANGHVRRWMLVEAHRIARDYPRDLRQFVVFTIGEKIG